MSLEQAINENTIAIRALIAVMQNKPVSAELPPAEVIANNATPSAAEKHSAHGGEGATLADEVPLTYAGLRDDFLALVKSNKPAALALLDSFKVKTLKELEGKEVFYKAIAAKIAEANNG